MYSSKKVIEAITLLFTALKAIIINAFTVSYVTSQDTVKFVAIKGFAITVCFFHIALEK